MNVGGVFMVTFQTTIKSQILLLSCRVTSCCRYFAFRHLTLTVLVEELFHSSGNTPSNTGQGQSCLSLSGAPYTLVLLCFEIRVLQEVRGFVQWFLLCGE